MVAPWYTREIGTAMPSNIPAITNRIEPEVKREASAILDELGLSMSTAVNTFLRAVIRKGGMPFEMKVGKTRSDNQ
ncbi:type II toxin-antitoxin system RelB/DinJ family antitoxin [Megamonas sp.]|uniref:type II toxin-antitoxin system RelB/DinJ family antitoxin n=1 Tax=Megamonas sp. TaxID=2049033 RepID=UPI00338D4F10